ncbi:MAG: polyprenol monophosphomannose synthase [Cryomorphaceae bacterium]|nr:polyprenol monophosphomannose synthase [Cryomorphaceae bacterium]
MSESIVVIPTFNECENIPHIIKAVLNLPDGFDVLVVDDNSPDGTSEVVKVISEQFPDRVHLEVRAEKSGLGTAYLHGFRWALDRDYKYIFEMDADFSHDPADLPRLLEPIKADRADLTIGSRYIKGVNVVNWPMSRVILSYFASKYVRFILRLPVMDTTAGFKCYRREVLERIDFGKIKFVGYAFQIEMKFTAWKMGFRIEEVPVIFTDRTVGESKMSHGIIKEAVFGVLLLRWKSLFRKFK